jgi:manganese transport protein
VSLVSIIGLSFLAEMIIVKPAFTEVTKGFIPSGLSGEALYIAIGIIGATVMPHNLYLHSSLVQTRRIKKNDEGIRKALRFNFYDSAIALNAAFFVNAAILILAATAFHKNGLYSVADISDAHHLLDGIFGSLAPTLFAIALIAAGQSSTITGTMAGQIVMEGYLHLRINPWLRRLITRLIAIVPAMLVIFIYGESKVDALLVGSQIVLSLQLGFAVIPLIHFVSDKTTMGEFAISTPIKILSWIVAGILVALNGRLVIQELTVFYESDVSILFKSAMIIPIVWLSWLFLVMTFLPLFKKRKARKKASLHGEPIPIIQLDPVQHDCIAIALDFTEADKLLIENAVARRNDTTHLVLIHVVESASAGYLGDASDDEETRLDRLRLEQYQEQLIALGLSVTIQLGYRSRVREIVRITQECKADMLVMGAHRHSGLKDYLFGETIEGVRHALAIPVLVVNIR